MDSDVRFKITQCPRCRGTGKVRQYVSGLYVFGGLEERNRSIVADYEREVPYKELAAKYGLSTGRVNQIVRRYYRKSGKPYFTTDEMRKQRMLARYEDGASQQTIAAEFGLRVSTVRYQYVKRWEQQGKR